MTNQYDDIINLPHLVSKKHPRMSRYDRAAQFAPFSALTGHKESIEQTARITDKKPIIDENQRNILDFKLNYILNNFKVFPNVEITYFSPDKIKKGGSIETITGKITKIDQYENLVKINHQEIKLNDIISIESDIFDNLEYF